MLRHHDGWHRTASSAVAHLVSPEASPSPLFTLATSAVEPPVPHRGLVIVARE
ncbi:hypothetical protein ACIQ6R_15520 [Streptomyces sp. NPDC096048]|uniref:hypothetical protein n=1 Tax=Streptomyces sp. NPDC096048 TaxID=3366072 RepID=UPI0037F3CB5B